MIKLHRSKRTCSKAFKILLFGCTSVLAAGVQAVPLVTGLGGTSGFGQLAMNPNDDSSSNLLDLPFALNFFGTTYNQFYVNNNGNITFNNPVSSYTPSPFPISNQPMIAPFWADVDTRGANGGNVYVAAPNATTAVVTWNNVGYYSAHDDKVNNFQLVLRDRSADTNNAGDFDIEFRYDLLQWTTGDASGGSGGFGGTPAQAGFEAGDGVNFFAIPGSFTSSVLDLQNQTNVSGGGSGLWQFAIRNGTTPGQTPANPIFPVIVDDTFVFEFDVELNQTVFIDPEVAIGYDYAITDPDGPLFASVLLPEGFGDDMYEIWLWDGTEYIFASDLAAGDVYLFGDDTDRFRVLGIEPSANIDPTDPLGFVTGLTFDAQGRVSMSQTPITFFVDDGDVPVPNTIFLFSLGLVALRLLKRTESV